MIIKSHAGDHLPKYLIRLFKGKSHMQQFVASGKVYMNTLEFFRNMEEGFQGDHKEGKLIDKSMHVTLAVSSKNDFSNPDVILKDVEWLTNGYVYCFFAAQENDIAISDGKLYYNQETPLNLKQAILQYRKENEGHDTHVVILDGPKTIQEIERQLGTVEFGGYQGYVAYVESGSVSSQQIYKIMSERPWESAFVKPKRYQYQKEWRVFIDTKPSADHAELYMKDMKKLVVGYFNIPAAQKLE